MARFPKDSPAITWKVRDELFTPEIDVVTERGAQ